jgi:hypothetical protein
MKIFGICLLMAALAAPSFGNDKKAKVDEDPVVFGMISQNLGCVIFKEYRKTNTKFWGVAVTQKTFSGLEVIETQNYDLAQKKWIEDQDSMNDLQRIAIKDRIKFVKIPEKYTDNQLTKARTACKEPSVTPQPEKPDAQ